MYQRSDIKEGMTVRSIDGEKLGRVFAIQEGEFLIEKGLFFPKDYVCRYSEISDIRDGEIILLHGKEGLHRFSVDEERGALAGTGGGAGVGPSALTANASAAGKAELTVPLHKDVVVEEKELSVPVRRERVRVERRDVQDRPAMRASFQEEPVVPLRAEEAAETVRRERVDIRGDGEAEDARELNLTPDDPTQRRS